MALFTGGFLGWFGVLGTTAVVLSALTALGYKPQEASRVVRAVPSDGLSTEDIIRQALKSMAG